MIVPAVIPESFNHLQHALNAVSRFAKEVQVDIVDGAFVPPKSWPYHAGEWREIIALVNDDGIPAEQLLEVDLMIMRPEETLEEWIGLGFTRFVIHTESTEELSDIIDTLHREERIVGLSLGNDTDLSVLDPYYEQIDFVQCMGIAKIGSQGNPFDERVLERVRTIKEKHPDLEVSVDGSVNMETIPKLKDAGVSRFVSGSAIFGASDPETAFRELTNLAQ